MDETRMEKERIRRQTRIVQRRGQVFGTKSGAVIWFALVLVAGCVSSKSKPDTFEAFRSEVIRKMPAKVECSPVERLDAESPRFFRVTPAGSAAHVLIREREFVSEAEWHRRFNEGVEALPDFYETATQLKEIGQTELTPELKRQAATLVVYWNLPRWSFHDISIDVSLVVPEIVYEGFERDENAAQALFDHVVRLLKPYQQEE